MIYLNWDLKLLSNYASQYKIKQGYIMIEKLQLKFL